MSLRNSLSRKDEALKIQDTTGFSRVVFHFLPSNEPRTCFRTPPTLVEWCFNFYLISDHARRTKLKHHSTRVGGVSDSRRQSVRSNLTRHAAKAGGVFRGCLKNTGSPS